MPAPPCFRRHARCWMMPNVPGTPSQRFRGVIRGTVRIATVALPRDLNVMSVLMDFRAAHPGVQVHLLHDGARDLVGLVADGEVDSQ
jgi:DNA-binding transcriptional LysR family regulator